VTNLSKAAEALEGSEEWKAATELINEQIIEPANEAGIELTEQERDDINELRILLALSENEAAKSAMLDDIKQRI